MFLRVVYSELLDLNLSMGIDWTNFSFCAITAVFKYIISVILDEYFPHSLPMGTSDNIRDHRANTSCLMDDKNSKSSSSTVENKNSKSSSSTVENKTSKSNLSTNITAWVDKNIKIGKNMGYTLVEMGKILNKLDIIKTSYDIKIFEGADGNLAIDVPETMSSTRIEEVRNEILALDLKYNRALERYTNLLEKDRKLRGLSGPSHDKFYKSILEQHKKVYN